MTTSDFDPNLNPRDREQRSDRRTAIGAASLFLSVGGIVAALGGFLVFWSSFELAALLWLLSWLSTLLGIVLGAIGWSTARGRRDRDWHAVAATLLGLATLVSWGLFLFWSP
ncbi:MAG TPA: hypothetical protein VFR38_17000 [Gaiellaceae bacterium]|nr:hypothetical protein [Gaiellaceae bacterium]